MKTLPNPRTQNAIMWERIKGRGEHWRALFNGVEIGGYSVVEKGKLKDGIQVYFGDALFDGLAPTMTEAREWIFAEWRRWLLAAQAVFPMSPEEVATVRLAGLGGEEAGE